MGLIEGTGKSVDKIVIRSKTINGENASSIGGKKYIPIEELQSRYSQNVAIGNVLQDHQYILNRNVDYVRSTI